ncbi:hypothetical protein E2320_015502 [Naja naja]|nr:hypothetical protein E2320_015502 [Naja naja]
MVRGEEAPEVLEVSRGVGLSWSNGGRRLRLWLALGPGVGWLEGHRSLGASPGATWLDSMLEKGSWIGLRQKETTWEFIGCKVGRYGYACEEECPECRNSSLCNMLTGFCDEKTTCLDRTSLESCSGMKLQLSLRWKGCVELSHGGDFKAEHCYEKKKSACKRPAERDLDVFSGFWDSVVISTTLSLSANSSYNNSKDECIKHTDCLGFGLWQNGYFLLNGYTLVGGGFGPSVLFLKSACDHGYYGEDCYFNCPRCHWEKFCHPLSGTCEKPVICAAPESIGTCSLGLYSLKCSLGAGWWYWQGTCYWIERTKKVWLQEMINQPMWVGLKWHAELKEWLWGNGTSTNTNVNIFEKYKGHIIPQRENVLPRDFSNLQSAEEECIFERAICTGVVFSQKRYHMVSGKEIFKSLNAKDILYLKSVCSAGFYGTSCETKCQKCKDDLPCNPITGKCIAPTLTKCGLDSPDPKCTKPVFTGICPKLPQWYYFSRACYFVENIKKDTWDNARIACQGFKKTDLVKITNSREKMWVQYKGDDSWVGFIFYKRSSQYLWVDNSSSVFQNAWVIRRNRRYIPSNYDCGVAFKDYLSVADCSRPRKWICKREEVVDLFAEHDGRAFYFPDGVTPKYPTLTEAKQACLAWQMCTGVTHSGKYFILHNSIDLYNTRNKMVRTSIKSICSAGRYGETCERVCPKCDDDAPCNPHTGLCSDSVFCSKNDSSFTCQTGTLIGGRCPVEDNWIYWRGSCYYIHKGENKKWRQARYMCRQYSNTDLLWITSTAEKKFLLSVLPSGTYWIGLNGIKFCTHVRWSYTNASDLDIEWLYKKSWSIFWKCCVYFTVPKETKDFRKFDGYFLVGFTKDSKSANHTSLSEAFQHCRIEGKHCTGIQKIRTIYITLLAKRLVLIIGNDATFFTAYLKSACALRYYGAECGMVCSCNGSESCNPLNGQCAENEQCNENHIKNNCQQDVIHLKCPKDLGWWYWNNSCYYIEPAKSLTWEQAKKFCMSYHETKLLPIPSDEEKVWLTTMLKDDAWVESEMRKMDMTNSKDSFKQAHLKCTLMLQKGTFEYASCSSVATWVCKRSVDTDMFWEYSTKILMFPLGKKTYEKKEYAKSACLLEKECTGISYWKKKYRPISGKELISTQSNQNTAYIKTACSEGHYGSYCQKICPECPEDRPCNRLTGECAEELTCAEKKHMHLCKFSEYYYFGKWFLLYILILTSSLCHPISDAQSRCYIEDTYATPHLKKKMFCEKSEFIPQSFSCILGE